MGFAKVWVELFFAELIIASILRAFPCKLTF